VTATLELRAGAARVLLAPEVGGAIAAYEWRGEPVLRTTSEEALRTGDVRRFSSYPLLPFSNRIAGATLQWGVLTISRWACSYGLCTTTVALQFSGPE
jgi:galactose mutarotase-like enzyme